MKVIGKWSKTKDYIRVIIPKIRKVGNKKYPYSARYLVNDDAPLSPKEQIEDIERDLSKELKMHIKLIPTTARGGGDIMEV